MPALTGSDQQTIRSGCGGDAKSMAVVKLFTTENNPHAWSDTNIVGGAALVSSGSTHSLKIIDLKNGQVVFEQEFYSGMDYDLARSFFHTFEISGCVAGFCFADEGEASSFGGAVKSALGGGGGNSSGGSGIRTTTTTTTTTKSHSKTSSPSTPTRSSSSSSKKSSSKKKKKRGGFFSKLKNMVKGDDQQPADFSISGPTGFRHDSHIGWDPENGFEIRNIPPAWRKLFQAAGVKKSELKDADTAKFIMDTVATAVMGDNPTDRQAGGAPGAGGAPAPPPAPDAPAPPPAPGPPPPPSATAATTGGGGGGGAGGGGRGGLLAQIQTGKNLKHVEAGQGLPDIDTMSDEGKGNLADTLANALVLRRAATANDSDDDDSDDDAWNDSDDDW